MGTTLIISSRQISVVSVLNHQFPESLGWMQFLSMIDPKFLMAWELGCKPIGSSGIRVIYEAVEPDSDPNPI